MYLRPKTRTLRSFVLRALVPRAIGFGLVAAALALGQAIAVNPSAHSVTTVDDEAVRVPVWTLADAVAYPECVPSRVWPSGTPAESLVVHDVRVDRARKLSFDHAWRLNHNGTGTDDVWVVGVCGQP